MLQLGHKRSDLYQQVVQLAKEIYGITDTFPERERAVLVYTLRRLAVLLCQDFVTGSVRKGKKQRRVFEICCEHCVALDAQLELAIAVHLIADEQTKTVASLLNSIYESLTRLAYSS